MAGALAGALCAIESGSVHNLWQQGCQRHIRFLRGIAVSWRRTCGCGLLAFSVGMSSGCYVYTPAGEAPAPGTRLSFDLNDRGRVGLGGKIGPSASKVEGTLKNIDSAFEMSVLSVEYLNGERNTWTGEALTEWRD